MAADLGLKPICHNPYMFNVSQLVECVHVVHGAIDLIDDILDTTDDLDLIVPVEPCAGEGIGAIEVPRGILYHYYEYDDQGPGARSKQ